jgi:hypothetical protein
MMMRTTMRFHDGFRRIGGGGSLIAMVLGISTGACKVAELAAALDMPHGLTAHCPKKFPDRDTWTLIASVTIPDGGTLWFSAPDSPLFARRFYRTRPSP